MDHRLNENLETLPLLEEDTEPMFFVCFKGFIYLFLERGEEREKERERNISLWLPLMCPLLVTWPATQACALAGNGTCDSLVRRLVLDPLSHTSQGRAHVLMMSF